MKKTRRLKATKKLLISVDKVRDLQPDRLGNVAGGNADPIDPCPHTHTTTQTGAA